MVIGQYKIDCFEWNKPTHTLVTHFENLDLPDLKTVPDQIEVIGKTCTVMFKKQGDHDHVVLYEPINDEEAAKIFAPEGNAWSGLILVIRNWH